MRASVAVVAPAGQEAARTACPPRRAGSRRAVAEAVAPAGRRPLFAALAGGIAAARRRSVCRCRRCPRSAHDMQLPAHSVLQQTPWAQMPLAHSVAARADRAVGLEAARAAAADAGRRAVGVRRAGRLAGGGAAHEREAGGRRAAPTQVAGAVAAAGRGEGRRAGRAGRAGRPCPARSSDTRPPGTCRCVPQLAAPQSRQVPAGSGCPSGTLVQMPIDAGQRARLAGAGAGRSRSRPPARSCPTCTRACRRRTRRWA